MLRRMCVCEEGDGMGAVLLLEGLCCCVQKSWCWKDCKAWVAVCRSHGVGRTVKPVLLCAEEKSCSIRGAGERWDPKEQQVRGVVELEPDTQVRIIRRGVLRYAFTHTHTFNIVLRYTFHPPTHSTLKHVCHSTWHLQYACTHIQTDTHKAYAYNWTPCLQFMMISTCLGNTQWPCF